MRIFFISFVLALYLVLPASAGRIDIGAGTGAGAFNMPVGPRLLYPIYDTVTLTGKEYLEFRWINDYVGVDRFIFSLYKGYNTYGKNLIYKQDLPATESSLNIKSELFEDGQVYTWTLVEVVFGGEKSDKSFDSFKVIKK